MALGRSINVLRIHQYLVGLLRFVDLQNFYPAENVTTINAKISEVKGKKEK